ncbi:hypothetical protein EG68_00447 [Paragonimus skrjabini miyazakii]|uniref:Pleckstrin homology domain-containing family G member 7 n=1 Tax=Paragonimus skrjabini miyazakii TaxID=59628 RepID=A0A8S9Z6J7_9TREM|nr:hypothetical protein EG68_00447 [Paragonimus skrjabini miyazakii]
MNQSPVSSVNVFRERQKRMLRKQHTIADLSSRMQSTMVPQDFDPKRRAKVFLKLIERRSRSKESLLDLCDALQRITPSTFQDHYIESFRNSHWSELTNPGISPSNLENVMSEKEIRRREAVWELFKSELIFFIDHLMVLKNCFMEPLKKLQVDGYLMFIEPANLFGNLDDLCYVSHTLCRELIGNLIRDSTQHDFGSTGVLLRPLKRWSEHSKDGQVYHNYCLNYDSALTYLESLRKHEQFNEFEKVSVMDMYSPVTDLVVRSFLKWCEQDPRCRRLQLTDLLIAPMQHYMKIPLLLASIRRYTAETSEQDMLTSCLDKVESSLKSLEDKMMWLKNFERLQEIQSQLIWPSVSELEPRVFIPELLRHSLARQPCERLIANPKRQLLHEGLLTLNDGSKIIEIFAFLFDDFLLITRIKKQPKKKSFSENPLNPRGLSEGGVFVVYRQAIALDRFTIHDLGIAEATANGLRHAIVLVLITRFQQITGVYTLQAANELEKQRWLEKLRNSQQLFQMKLKTKLYGIDSVHQTNKHSKLVSNRSRTSGTSDGLRTDLRQSGEPVIAIQRASSVSPASRAMSPRPVIHEDDLLTTERDVQSKPLQYDTTILQNSPNDKIHACTFNNSPDDTPDVLHEKSPEDLDLYFKDSLVKVRLSMDPTILSSSTGREKYRETSPSKLDCKTTQKMPVIDDQCILDESQSTSTARDSRPTKVEFLYNATGLQAFSPPLSPTLHRPCASVPSAVTLPCFYDQYVSESDSDENKPQASSRRARPTSSSLRIVRPLSASSTSGENLRPGEKPNFSSSWK